MIRGMVRGMIRGYGSQNSNFPPLLKSAHLKKRHSHIYIYHIYICIILIYLLWLEIRRPAGVSDWKVLFLFLFLACTCSFVAARFCFVRIKSTPPPPIRRLLLPPSSPSAKLVVPVANDTAYNIAVVYRYSSQDAHGTKLIDQCSFGMRSLGCSSRHVLLKLLLIYGSVFVSSSSSSSSSSYSLLFCFSLRLPPSVRINFPWGNLSPLPPCLLPCSALLSSQRLIHSTWRYFAGVDTNLVYDQ